jgi:hypothetical protein
MLYNLSLTLLKMGKSCPKHVELILEINKSVIVASSWSFYIILPTLMMHGQTQIKFRASVTNVGQIHEIRAVYCL